MWEADEAPGGWWPTLDNLTAPVAGSRVATGFVLRGGLTALDAVKVASLKV